MTHLCRLHPRSSRPEPSREAEIIPRILYPGGVLAGHVRTPANVSPVQVSGRSVVTIVSDEMGRRTVAIHDFRWTGAGRPDR